MSGPGLPEWEFSQDVLWIAGNLEIIPTSNCESWKDIGNSSKSLNITRHTLAKTGYAKCFVKCEIFIPEKLFYMELEVKWPSSLIYLLLAALARFLKSRHQENNCFHTRAEIAASLKTTIWFDQISAGRRHSSTYIYIANI